MLLSSLKKMRSKPLMRVTDLCRGGVSQFNYGGYNSKSGWRRHIYSSENAYSISQNF
jgi:hypothetical protein